MHADPKQVKSIFLTALEKATREERAAFLGAACGGDGDLRRRVEELLSVHEEPGGLPGIPDREIPPEGAEDPVDLSFLVPSAKPGSLGRLGHYDVLAVVGQ